jgi:MinD-like ATPase involved in chromosome partitioning or flagellar assembly
VLPAFSGNAGPGVPPLRILPVSSGKGGVGKTTFALNLALSLAKTRPTVLIDLDTGTSSLRNFLAAPVEKDLFHFLKKGSLLEECRQALPASMDPDRAFANFSFIASPRGFIHDIVNFTPETRDKLVHGINSLRADYVIIDSKAGLDANVLDFLPIANSGIILFTPGLRAATLAAAEIAKAILFRMLRIMLNAPRVRERMSLPGDDQPSSFYRRLFDFLQAGGDGQGKNLDDFISEAALRFPQDNFVRVFRYYVENFKVYYVLNKFNSVAESLENTVKPLVENIFRSVSGKVGFYNLGWVVENEEIKKSSESGIPYMVRRHYQKRQAPPAKPLDNDATLRSLCGLAVKKQPPEKKPVLADQLRDQIDLLRTIYLCNAGGDPETNLDFIAARIREFSANSNHEFGMKHIFSEGEFLERFQARIV